MRNFLLALLLIVSGGSLLWYIHITKKNEPKVNIAKVETPWYLKENPDLARLKQEVSVLGAVPDDFCTEVFLKADPEYIKHCIEFSDKNKFTPLKTYFNEWMHFLKPYKDTHHGCGQLYTFLDTNKDNPDFSTLLNNLTKLEPACSLFGATHKFIECFILISTCAVPDGKAPDATKLEKIPIKTGFGLQWHIYNLMKKKHAIQFEGR